MRHFEQEITDPAAWLAQDGDGWQCRERLTLSDMPLLLMRDFKETNHCSLTALTSVFTYFRRQGVTGLPADPQELFSWIRAKARAKWMFHPAIGTFPWQIAPLANQVWKNCNYPARARNVFFFPRRDALETLLIDELRALRPGIISFTHNRYHNHSVTFFGYEYWEKGNEHRIFLRVNNHWTRALRFVELTHLGEGSDSYIALCLFRL